MRFLLLYIFVLGIYLQLHHIIIFALPLDINIQYVLFDFYNSLVA